MNERLILMGVIGKPHGVRGLVRVNAYTEDPDALAEYPLSDRTGRRFSLEWLHGNVAQLSEITPKGNRAITDRNEVERLTNTELFAPRAALPAPDEEEFYLADLIGLKARNEAGVEIGSITAVHDYGGGPSLEISPGGLLVPFTRAAVPVVDIAAGHVTVAPPVEVVVPS
ncbi:ribosome maturation factor RimM [Acidocella sp.]|uniref:ribosome maturation factor RimM n=1 Tax=Acidocella sp. TaxID=50710 RepID=UPI00261C2C88|nr:ribosome maturation factor RimM [Acidocella sp.]MDD2795917.1 ribosome maturation factor RimM [Acidocella sp.]